jgi:hypothetical protein
MISIGRFIPYVAIVRAASPEASSAARAARAVRQALGQQLVLAIAASLLLAGCGLDPSVQPPLAEGVAAVPGEGAASTATARPAAPTPTPAPTPVPTATQVPRGAVLERRQEATLQPAQINQLLPRLYTAGTSLPAKYPVDHYIIRYLSSDASEAPVQLVAQLFVPRSDAPLSAPVFVYGPGTTGLADQCAPSREQATVRNWGDYYVHMLSYATQGYIGILPDYTGFNDESQLQRYFVADLEARVLLDAARAVYRFFEGAPSTVTPERAAFFAGYSQGGHAVFAVRDVAARYAPDVPVKGVIGHGATTDVTTLLRESPYFAPYVLYSYANYYGPDAVDISQLLQPRWLPTLDADMATRCIDAMPAYYGNDPRQLYHPNFYNALFGDRLAEAFPRLKEVLDRNSTGLVPSSIPAFVPQGTADPIITTRSQEAFVAKLCAAGGRVTYTPYANVHHFQARQVSFKDSLGWMETIRSGGTPRFTCAGS